MIELLLDDLTTEYNIYLSSKDNEGYVDAAG